MVFGQTATFDVVATGSGTLTYQWQRNGLDISGANTDSYTTSPVSYANDGYTYRVLVTDDNGTTPSQLATLNVVPPTISCNDPMEPNDRSYEATVPAARHQHQWPDLLGRGFGLVPRYAHHEWPVEPRPDCARWAGL